jgi:hypothetical protein
MGLRAAEPAPPVISPAANGQSVVLSEDAETARLGNGIVWATIKKANGNLLSLRYRGTEMLSRGGGYWNIYESKENGRLISLPSR